MPLSKITNLRCGTNSGQHVHHFVGFCEMAKRSKEEHGGDPNATGKRSIRAAKYCDQKSAEQQTRDDDLMPELSRRPANGIKQQGTGKADRCPILQTIFLGVAR